MAIEKTIEQKLEDSYLIKGKEIFISWAHQHGFPKELSRADLLGTISDGIVEIRYGDIYLPGSLEERFMFRGDLEKLDIPYKEVLDREEILPWAHNDDEFRIDMRKHLLELAKKLEKLAGKADSMEIKD